MTWTLTAQDERTIELLAANPEEASKLKRYFQRYGGEQFVQRYASRELFFRTHVKQFRTRNRIPPKIDDTSLFRQIKAHLCKLRAPYGELEDLTQEVLLKFLRLGFIDRYNPLASPWNNYLQRGVQNTYITHQTQGRRVFHRKIKSLDEPISPKDPTRTKVSVLLDYLGEGSHDILLRQEVLADIRASLDFFQGCRRRRSRKIKWSATLQAPGTYHCPVQSPTSVELLTIKGSTAWGRLPSERKVLLFPLDCLTDISEVTTRSRILLTTINPRRLFDLYLQGGSREEIAEELHILPANLKAWNLVLEDAFANWWASSPYIEPEVRHLGRSRICPGCAKLYETLPTRYTQFANIRRVQGRTHYQVDPFGCEVEAHWCSNCYDWSICRSAPGEALRYYLKGQLPWVQKRSKKKKLSGSSVEVYRAVI